MWELRMDGERIRRVLRLRKRYLDEYIKNRKKVNFFSLLLDEMKTCFESLHDEQQRFKCLKKFHSETRIFLLYFVFSGFLRRFHIENLIFLSEKNRKLFKLTRSIVSLNHHHHEFYALFGDFWLYFFRFKLHLNQLWKSFC